MVALAMEDKLDKNLTTKVRGEVLHKYERM